MEYGFQDTNDVLDDYEDYVDSIYNKQISKFKSQYDFSKKLISEIKEENENKEELHNFFNEPIYDIQENNLSKNICIFLEKNNVEKLVENFKEKNIIKPNNERNKRRSCTEINKKLDKYFEKNPTKWEKNYINTISFHTKLPFSTIYKWNWNRIKLKIKQKNN